MTVPVWIEQQNGTFTATVLGAPGLRAVADTRDKAVAALRGEVAVRLSAGELLMMDVEPRGVLALAGKYQDDPGWKESWDEIVREAYRERDEQKAREFPE